MTSFSLCNKSWKIAIVKSMENIWFTIIAAVVLMAFAVLCLCIGLLIAGKKLKRGCGLTPKKKGEKGSSSCSLCGSHKPCDEEDKDAP